MDSAELLDLLGNENRRRILRLLSRRPCYVTEIGEYLDVSPKAVIDHLRKLEDAGLVESRTDGSRRKYFHIARDVRLEVNVSRHGFGTKSAYPANPGMDLSGRVRHVKLELDPTVDGVGAGNTADSAAPGSETSSSGPAGGPDATAPTDGTSSPATADRSAESTESPTSSGDSTAAADGAGAKPDGTTPGIAGGTNEEVRPNGGGPTDAASDLTGLAQQYDRLRELENELSLAQRWVRGQLSAVLDGLAERLGTEGDARLFAEVLAAVESTDGSVPAVVGEVDASRPEVESALRQLGEIGVVARRDGGWAIVEP